jgi:transcriptional regulator with GAF, ATPase, and Fis domain/pSer/pThr/pTyr-binding forkhead associated (FHA) protein
LNNPRLVATSGYLKGTAWPANGGSLSLGRDASNQIVVGDAAVSRKHCSVTEVASGVFELADLDSANGTLLNGNQVSRNTVRHGDRIRIGSSEYVFLIGPDELGDSRSGSEEGTAFATMAIDRSGMPAGAAGMGRMARDLSAFFKIANVINSTSDPLALQREMLALISEVIPAAQGAIVLQPAGNEEAGPPCTWNRDGLAGHVMVIRQELVQQATWERCAVFTSAADTAAGEHVLCVPLAAVERTLGVIYLSAPVSSPPFKEEHAYFLSSVSRIAAVTLESLFKMDSLRAENERLRVEVKADATLIGESRPMQRVAEFITRVAKGDSTVLIRGESGTGKELIARAIHAGGLRPHKPFVAINCAAIPEALLESELFGHEKGAFTGAVAVRKGKFEMAEDGTLFLDEIGEMAPLLQAKLLRVLQQREFERLGGTRLLPFNARVVAATNKNLETAIKAGEFRQDLYYRLNVISVASPPLRERRDDIPVLALYFANKYAARCKRGFKGIAAEARSLLMQYSWPGNVRELENAIEHAIVMGLTDEILPEDLPDALLEEQSPELGAARYHHTLNQTKKQLVLTALDEAKGSPADAARLLGIHPKYLHRLIRNLNLKYDGKRLG